MLFDGIDEVLSHPLIQLCVLVLVLVAIGVCFR